MFSDNSNGELTFARQLGYLLTVVVVLGFAYGLVPAVLSPVRYILAMVQLGFMAMTMWITIQRVLEDY